jgi:hypothetical protein
MADANPKEIMTFFDMKAKDFIKEWKLLTEQDKQQIREGIGDGTLDY